MPFNKDSFKVKIGISSIYMHLCLSYKQDKSKFVTKESLSKDANVSINFIEEEEWRLIARGMIERNSLGELRAVNPPENIFSIHTPLSFFGFCQKEVNRKIFKSKFILTK